MRSRSARWSALRDVLARLHTLMDANVALDAIGPGRPREKVEAAAAFERELQRLDARLATEVSALTVERLRAELKERMETNGKGGRPCQA